MAQLSAPRSKCCDRPRLSKDLILHMCPIQSSLVPVLGYAFCAWSVVLGLRAGRTCRPRSRCNAVARLAGEHVLKNMDTK